MIRIVPPEDYADARRGLRRRRSLRLDRVLERQRGRGVHAAAAGLAARPAGARPGTKLCAVGPATTERLATYGLKVDLVPAEYGADAIAHAFSQSGDLDGLDVLIPRADIGREVVGDELRRQGVNVTEVVAYRTMVVDPEREGEPDVYRMLLDRQLDVVTFASASSVRSFVRAFGAEQVADLLQSGGGGVDRTGHRRSGTAVQASTRRSCRPSTRCRRWSTRSSTLPEHSHELHAHTRRARSCHAGSAACDAPKRCARSCARRTSRPTR